MRDFAAYATREAPPYTLPPPLFMITRRFSLFIYAVSLPIFASHRPPLLPLRCRRFTHTQFFESCHFIFAAFTIYADYAAEPPPSAAAAGTPLRRFELR